MGTNGRKKKKKTSTCFETSLYNVFFYFFLYSGLYKLIMLVFKRKNVQLTAVATISKYKKLYMIKKKKC